MWEAFSGGTFYVWKRGYRNRGAVEPLSVYVNARINRVMADMALYRHILQVADFGRDRARLMQDGL
jgi:hypothetical protein